jgi:hypothetical protein
MRPPSLLYNEHWVSLSGVKRRGRGFNHPPTASAEVEERVELYLCTPSKPSWPVIMGTLLLPYIYAVSKKSTNRHISAAMFLLSELAAVHSHVETKIS